MLLNEIPCPTVTVPGMPGESASTRTRGSPESVGQLVVDRVAGGDSIARSSAPSGPSARNTGIESALVAAPPGLAGGIGIEISAAFRKVSALKSSGSAGGTTARAHSDPIRRGRTAIGPKGHSKRWLAVESEQALTPNR